MHAHARALWLLSLLVGLLASRSARAHAARLDAEDYQILAALVDARSFVYGEAALPEEDRAINLSQVESAHDYPAAAKGLVDLLRRRNRTHAVLEPRFPSEAGIAIVAPSKDARWRFLRAHPGEVLWSYSAPARNRSDEVAAVYGERLRAGRGSSAWVYVLHKTNGRWVLDASIGVWAR